MTVVIPVTWQYLVKNLAVLLINVSISVPFTERYNKQPDQMLEPVSGGAGKSIRTYILIPASITNHHKLWKFSYSFNGTFFIPSLMLRPHDNLP